MLCYAIGSGYEGVRELIQQFGAGDIDRRQGRRFGRRLGEGVGGPIRRRSRRTCHGGTRCPFGGSQTCRPLQGFLVPGARDAQSLTARATGPGFIALELQDAQLAAEHGTSDSGWLAYPLAFAHGAPVA